MAEGAFDAGGSGRCSFPILGLLTVCLWMFTALSSDPSLNAFQLLALLPNLLRVTDSKSCNKAIGRLFMSIFNFTSQNCILLLQFSFLVFIGYFLFKLFDCLD